MNPEWLERERMEREQYGKRYCEQFDANWQDSVRRLLGGYSGSLITTTTV